MSSDHRRQVSDLCQEAFGADLEVTSLVDINRGRGAFSSVLLAELRSTRPQGPTRADPGLHPTPETVVAKLPIDGPNGRAATVSGAYRREALAYREILLDPAVAVPEAYLVDEPGDGTCSLLLEDLTSHRVADQLDGLDAGDAFAVAQALARFHHGWSDPSRLGDLPVRRNTLTVFEPQALQAGLDSLKSRWAETVSDDERALFARLVAARSALVDSFDAQPPTLCHGDPRADNLVFAGDGQPVLFDWQQMAVQFGEADLAWMAATSLQGDQRRAIERDLIVAAGGSFDRYRLGLALPGLAVLMLAQRDLLTDRAHRSVAVSLRRIASALTDNETADYRHR